jgi:hypothetical protein
MKRSWPVVFGLAFLVLASAVPSAQATIDMTGRWVLLFKYFIPGPQPVTFVQTGTTLILTIPGDTLTGTIDPATGALTLSDNVPCNPPFGSGPTTLAGTVAADGLTFSGTYAKGVGPMCHPASTPVNGWRSPATCGNGVVDPGEQCDNGSNLPGGCCDPGCRFFASGTPCSTANVCVNNNTCDGAGTCVTGPPLACDACSSCDATAAACVASPAVSCRAPTVSGAAQLTLKSTGPRLGWKWTKGQATTLADFGDPLHTDTYALCVYDESHAMPSTLIRATVPSGTNWRAAGTSGFTYKDKLGVADGVTGISLRAGAAGQAKIKVAAKGSHLTLPPLPLALPVAVQLRGHGECWGADYLAAGIKKNTATEFSGKSSPSGAFVDDPTE